MTLHLVRASALAVAGAALCGAVALADSMGSMNAAGAKVYAISAQNGSGQTGTVTLVPMGDKTMVEVALVGASASTKEPAHVHPGSCSNLNPTPKYPLTSLEDGYSSTTLDVPVATLTAGGFAVNVHKSADALKTYVACGNLGA